MRNIVVISAWLLLLFVAVAAKADERPVGAILSTSQVLVWDAEHGEYAVRKLGDALDGGKIVTIAADHIVVEREDGSETVTLQPAPAEKLFRRVKRMPAVIVGAAERKVEDEAPAKPAEAPVVAALVAAPVAAPAPVAPPVTADVPVLPPEPAVVGIPRDVLERELGDFSTLTRSVQIVRHSKGGFYLTQLQPGSFLERIGLRSSDIILRVDGRPILSAADAQAAWAWLRHTEHFSVEIVRAGHLVRLAYTIN